MGLSNTWEYRARGGGGTETQDHAGINGINLEINTKEVKMARTCVAHDRKDEHEQRAWFGRKREGTR